MASDSFLFRHGGEIRQALIMIEGNDGAFELLGHATLPRSGHRSVPVAAVRSTNSGIVHHIVREPRRGPHQPYWWRLAASDEAPILEKLIRATSPAAPGALSAPH
jgi:hypothetical protein